MLCGVYVGATRLVHGHHEKIAARPRKESRTAEDGRKHVFRGFAGYFEELVRTYYKVFAICLFC